LPLLYLHGLSTKDFVPALAEFFGTEAGLSASVISRLTASWESEVKSFMARDLSKSDFVYIWVDGVHFTIRLGEDKRLCCLVIVGVRVDGTKELVAIADGYRESTESWADLLRDAKRRGMRAPVLAVGDGALGFWTAVRDVFPETKEQRCWVHVTANVLNALPKSAQPAARKALAEIRDAQDRAHAEAAVGAFADEFGAKWPKAVAKITDNTDALLAFYDFPAEHWIHLKTTDERIKRSARGSGFSSFGRDGRAVQAGGAARRGSLEGPVGCAGHNGGARPGGPRWARLAGGSAGLPAADDVLISGLGLLEHGALSVADGLEGVGGGGSGASSTTRRLPGAKFEGPGLLGNQRGSGERVVDPVVDEVPADNQELAGGGD
ncbi:MAG: IS256 family transposase, partial [Anaerolineales bacterium]